MSYFHEIPKVPSQFFSEGIMTSVDEHQPETILSCSFSFLLKQGHSETVIEACYSDQVESLDQYCDSPVVLIHNGIMLTKAMSFSFYNINEGDTIYAIKTQRHQKEPDQEALTALKDSASIFNRIVDHRLNVIDFRSRRMKGLWIMPLFNEKNTPNPTTVRPKPDSPSTKELPILWERT